MGTSGRPCTSYADHDASIAKSAACPPSSPSLRAFTAFKEMSFCYNSSQSFYEFHILRRINEIKARAGQPFKFFIAFSLHVSGVLMTLSNSSTAEEGRCVACCCKFTLTK